MDVFQYEFMQRAILAALAISLIAPMLGVFLVLRRQSLMADTLSHVSLFGVALGFFFNQNPTITTLLVVVIAAVVLEYLRTLYKTYSEISTAILMSGGLACALVLMSMSGGNSATSIQQYLFGSIITISIEQVILLFALLGIITVLYILFRRPMYVMTFDESTAHVDGLPIKWMSIAFNVITGVAIAVMIPIAGALLVSAIMILPASIGMRIGKSFTLVIFCSMFIGLLGVMTGLLSSFYLESPPGASITLVFILLFFITGLIRKILLGARKNARKSR
ncbi:zinc transport system permease protein [Pilibacter termitis]|uniref:Zinc transport system permease protein n=1 Tax=Pilibacter termitis TaxID=263852 RepID=A0A1T4QXR7_9ENTE|nr:metal ABC transporter permease [Pilibacter termitis]SKA08572.1 zinc transport system permease protein [Pilibacter termitis]